MKWLQISRICIIFIDNQKSAFDNLCLLNFFSYNIIHKMDLFSFLYFTSPQFSNYCPIYYTSTAIQQNNQQFYTFNMTTQFKEMEKQNVILQSSVQTMDSLEQQFSQQPKIQRKKKTIKKNKDENFGWRNQNKDRNILSNILKMFVNYLIEQKGLDNYIKQICQKLELKNSVSDFHQFVQSKFPSFKSYISPKLFKSFLKDPSHPQSLRMVLKIIFIRFLKMDFNLILLKSLKIKKRSKLQQMKKSRELLQIIFKS